MAGAYERVMESRREIVEEIIKQMESGALFWEKKWRGSQFNPVSNAVYRGGNVFRLAMAAAVNGYEDPRWMTFKQAENEGWKVKKGSKGVMCEKWLFEKMVKWEDANGEIKYIAEPLKPPHVSYFVVFNGQQIEGIPEYEKTELPYDEKLALAEKFIASSECIIKEDGGEEAYYRPFDDSIHLPKRDAFNDAEAFLATAIHEMGHSTGHEKRLNRNMGNGFGSESYAKEELVAELSSVFVQADLGLDLTGSLQNHAAYLQSWMKVLKEDPNELFRACKKADEAGEYLVNNYKKYMQEQEKNINAREKTVEKAKKRQSLSR